MTYAALIDDMIAAQSELLGDQAVEIAREVRGLHVNGDGTVDEISVDGKVAADDLLRAYAGTAGPAAEARMAAVASAYESELDLPRSLESGE